MLFERWGWLSRGVKETYTCVDKHSVGHTLGLVFTLDVNVTCVQLRDLRGITKFLENYSKENRCKRDEGRAKIKKYGLPFD